MPHTRYPIGVASKRVASRHAQCTRISSCSHSSQPRQRPAAARELAMILCPSWISHRPSCQPFPSSGRRTAAWPSTSHRARRTRRPGTAPGSLPRIHERRYTRSRSFAHGNATVTGTSPTPRPRWVHNLAHVQRAPTAITRARRHSITQRHRRLGIFARPAHGFAHIAAVVKARPAAAPPHTRTPRHPALLRALPVAYLTRRQLLSARPR